MKITEELLVKYNDLQSKWCLGNASAIEFINSLFSAIELYDDLIDKDKEIEEWRIHKDFGNLFIGLHINEWFNANKQYYLPVMILAMNAFQDANNLAKSEDKKLRNLAFHIRNLPIELQIQTAFLVGGYDHMRKASVEIREFFAHESFEEWDK